MTYIWPRGLYGKFAKYFRPEGNEVPFAMFHKLIIDGQRYFLIFYVPEGGVNCRELKPGAEPLLFDERGRWVDDEKTFHKAMLMWVHGQYISPLALLGNPIIRSHNGMKKLVLDYLPGLPRLLEQNAERFARLGLQAEVDIVRRAYPAKVAYFRRLLEMGAGKVAWGEAHGWDSALELRYPHMLALHEGVARFDESLLRFAEKHRLKELEEAATRLFKRAEEKESGPWKGRDKLNNGLQVLSAPVIDKSEAGMLRYENGEWLAPDNVVEAYRSRLAYAREVDARPITEAERRHERLKASLRRVGFWLLAIAVISGTLYAVSLFASGPELLTLTAAICFLITGTISGNLFMYTHPNYQIVE